MKELPVKEHNLHLHVLAVLVEEVLEEVRDWLVGDVAAHHHVPEDWSDEESGENLVHACHYSTLR